jgi:hypothetical protein
VLQALEKAVVWPKITNGLLRHHIES